MSKAKVVKSRAEAGKPAKRNFLEAMEERVRDMEKDLEGKVPPVKAKSAASRKVMFKSLRQARIFLKEEPTSVYERDFEEKDSVSKTKSRKFTNDDHSEESEHSDNEAQGTPEPSISGAASRAEMRKQLLESFAEDSDKETLSEDSNTDQGSDYDDGSDYDEQTADEQLRLLMEPVEDELDDEDDEDEQGSSLYQEDFGEIQYDNYEDEDDENDDQAASSLERDRLGRSGSNKDRKLRLSLEDEDSDEDERVQSSFEKQQERLRRTISKLEEENIGEKPWMLRGEVTAKSRPMNSLLEQDVDFEHASRAAPLITEEVTESLESLIRQRIKDRAWDDVERRTASHVSNKEEKSRKLPELDTEKSKKSLSEVYDEQYMLKQQTPKAKEELPVETQKAHKEITLLFTKICQKLDGLSNFKFAPRAYPLADLQIRPLKETKKTTI